MEGTVGMVVVAGGGCRGTAMLRHVPRAAGVRPGRGTVLGRRTPDQDEVCVVWSAATRACDNDRTLNLPHPTLWAVRAVSATLRAAAGRRGPITKRQWQAVDSSVQQPPGSKLVAHTALRLECPSRACARQRRARRRRRVKRASTTIGVRMLRESYATRDRSARPL